MKQLIVSKQPNKEGIVRLTEKDYTYLVSVRRIKAGQTLQVSLNDAGTMQAEVFNINTAKRYVELKLLCSSAGKTVTPQYSFIVMQWLIKGQHMDLAVRQCTEAGAAVIFPVLGEFSVVREENKNQTERRCRIVREARQQSGSPVDTQLFEAAPLNCVLNSLTEYTGGKKTAKLMFTEVDKAEPSIFECLKAGAETVVLAIGCEGGISPTERELLLKNGFYEVHLKTNVLRAETAAIYALAAAQTILTV